jgi:uncharacterized protein YeaO (DUF488 family)
MLPVPQVDVALKRIYEKPAAADGRRVLVDRLWPRGVSKERAALDGWLRELAPSESLRKWYGHDPARWPEFRRRYRAELRARRPALDALRRLATGRRVTLLYAARDSSHSNAAVLKDLVTGH